jgi:hypothetical protein
MPVILLKITINSEILFQGLFKAFRLSVAFQMVTQSEMQFHIQGLSERTEETRHEFGTLVGGDMRWNSMLGEDMDNKKFSQLGKGDSIVS